MHKYAALLLNQHSERCHLVYYLVMMLLYHRTEYIIFIEVQSVWLDKSTTHMDSSCRSMAVVVLR